MSQDSGEVTGGRTGGEEISLRDAYELPDRLAPLLLPAEAELAALSRAAPLLRRVRALAEWAGTGRVAGPDGELTAADLADAARELGGGPAGEAGEPAPARLARLWHLALGTGFAELDAAGTAGPGEALGMWPGGTDDEVLDVWCAAFAGLLDSLETEAELDPGRSAGLDFMGAGTGLALTLFLAREDGVPVPAVSDAIQQDATAGLAMDEATEAWAGWTGEHGDPGAALLSSLAELGAVAVAEGEPRPGAAGDPVARLTPLAGWALREQLTAEGVEIPLL